MKASTAMYVGFLKADPEMRIRMQVIDYGSASRTNQPGSGESRTGEGEEVK